MPDNIPKTSHAVRDESLQLAAADIHTVSDVALTCFLAQLALS